MRPSAAVFALASALSVNAVDHVIKVGLGGTFFTPNSIQAAQGDTVSFEFHPKNHSVTQSTFAAPCTQSSGGVNSGFLATDPTATTFSQWQITIDNASAPLWFYCAQTNPAVHCHAGMVFAINATPEKSFQQFQANANATTGTSPPPTGATNPPPAANTGGAAPPVASPPASPAQSNPAGAPPPVNTIPGSAATNAPVAGAPPGGAGGAAAPIGATSAGTIPTGSVPSPAAGLPVNSSAPSLSGGAGGSGGAPPSGAIKVGAGMSSTIIVAALVALFL